MTAEPTHVPVAGTSNETRPLYWSIRRELWENRSVWMAPLAVAALVLFASLIHLIGLPHRIQKITDASKIHSAIVLPFSMAPAPIMLVSLLIGAFYSIDALYGERRDRAILFWKSLPVSDRTTVLAKISIPVAVLPAIAVAFSYVTVAVMLFWATMMFLSRGMSPLLLWSEYQVFEEPVVMLYGMAAHALWFAPVYAWLLLVSAWAKRLPLLWAVLPVIVIGVIEQIVFQTTHWGSFLHYRLGGAMREAFVRNPAQGNIEDISGLDPLRFVTAPGLWLGLAFAAGCVALAIRLRRGREPL